MTVSEPRRLSAAIIGLTALITALLPAVGAYAATGDVLSEWLPAPARGDGRGIAVDGATGRIFYTLRTTSAIYVVGVNGAPLATLSPVAFSGGPLAFDEVSGRLWAMNYQHTDFTVFEIDAATGATVSTCNIATVNPSHPAVTGTTFVGNFVDGLDYDPVRRTLWISSEQYENNWVVEIAPDCSILGAFVPTPRGAPTVRGPAGVAYDGAGLWHSYIETGIVETSRSGVASGVEFGNAIDNEDLEFDSITFSPLCAVWSHSFSAATDNWIRAYEIPCPVIVCGDGEVGGSEDCDDGNTDPADLCSQSCTLTFCGDGVVQMPNGRGTGGPLDDGQEACDDGNSIPGDGCFDCQTENCLTSGIEPIELVRGVISPDRASVILTWVSDASADGYNVWHVPQKQLIPSARQGGSGGNPIGCDPTASSSCWHLGAVAPSVGSRLFYQVRGVCGTSEAAE